MIVDKVNAGLSEKGFRNIRVNVNDIYLHSYEQEQGIYLVIVLDCPLGTEFTLAQYQHIRTQIHSNFMKRSNGHIRILSIICTNNVKGVRDLYTEGEEQWIIDAVNNNLILYEDQTGDFLGLREDIETILQSRTKEVEDEAIHPKDQKTTKKSVKNYFSKYNTLLVIINILVFFWMDLKGSSLSTRYLLDHGALYWPAMEQSKEYYRILTYMFLHSGFEHLINNMIVLLCVGDNLERAIGKWKYLIIYFGSGVIAGIASLSYNMLGGTIVVSVGASGAIFGIVGAMAFIVVINKGHLEDLSARQMILFVILSLYGGLTSQGVDNAAHVGGLVAGIIITVILYRRPIKRHKEGGIEL